MAYPSSPNPFIQEAVMGTVVRTVSHDGSLRGLTVDATDAAIAIVDAQNVSDALKGLTMEAVVAAVFIQRLMSVSYTHLTLPTILLV